MNVPHSPKIQNEAGKTITHVITPVRPSQFSRQRFSYRNFPPLQRVPSCGHTHIEIKSANQCTAPDEHLATSTRLQIQRPQGAPVRWIKSTLKRTVIADLVSAMVADVTRRDAGIVREGTFATERRRRANDGATLTREGIEAATAPKADARLRHGSRAALVAVLVHQVPAVLRPSSSITRHRDTRWVRSRLD